jgi:hypothetical protein
LLALKTGTTLRSSTLFVPERCGVEVRRGGGLRGLRRDLHDLVVGGEVKRREL